MSGSIFPKETEFAAFGCLAVIAIVSSVIYLARETLVTSRQCENDLGGYSVRATNGSTICIRRDAVIELPKQHPSK